MVKNIPISIVNHFVRYKAGKELFYYIQLFQQAKGGYIYKSQAKNLLNKINKDKRTINKRINTLIELGLLSESNHKYKLTSIIKVTEAIEGKAKSYKAMPYYFGLVTNFDEFMRWVIIVDGKSVLTEKSKEAKQKYKLLTAKNIEITDKNDPRLYSDTQGNKSSFMMTSDQGFYPLRSQGRNLNLSHVEIHNQRKKAIDIFLMEDQSYFCPKFESKKVESIQECLAFGNTQRNPEKYHPQRFVLNDQGYYSMRMEKLLIIKNFKPTKCYSSKSLRREIAKENFVRSLSNVSKCEDEGVAVVGELTYITQPRSFSEGAVHKRLTVPASPTLVQYSATTPRKAKLSSTFLQSIGAEPKPNLLYTQFAPYFDPKKVFTGKDYSLDQALCMLSKGTSWYSQQVAIQGLNLLKELNKTKAKFVKKIRLELNCLAPDSKAKEKLPKNYSFVELLKWEFEGTLYSLNSQGMVTKSNPKS